MVFWCVGGRGYGAIDCRNSGGLFVGLHGRVCARRGGQSHWTCALYLELGSRVPKGIHAHARYLPPSFLSILMMLILGVTFYPAFIAPFVKRRRKATKRKGELLRHTYWMVKHAITPAILDKSNPDRENPDKPLPSLRVRHSTSLQNAGRGAGGKTRHSRRPLMVKTRFMNGNGI